MALTPIITISVDTTDGKLYCNPAPNLSTPEIASLLTHFAGVATQMNTNATQQGVFQSILSKFIAPIAETVIEAKI